MIRKRNEVLLAAALGNAQGFNSTLRRQANGDESDCSEKLVRRVQLSSLEFRGAKYDWNELAVVSIPRVQPEAKCSDRRHSKHSYFNGFGSRLRGERREDGDLMIDIAAARDVSRNLSLLSLCDFYPVSDAGKHHHVLPRDVFRRFQPFAFGDRVGRVLLRRVARGREVKIR